MNGNKIENCKIYAGLKRRNRLNFDILSEQNGFQDISLWYTF